MSKAVEELRQASLAAVKHAASKSIADAVGRAVDLLSDGYFIECGVTLEWAYLKTIQANADTAMVQETIRCASVVARIVTGYQRESE